METRTDVVPDEALPRPLCGGLAWPSARRAASEALWRWHLALAGPTAGAADFETAARRTEAGERPSVVPDEVAREAYRACTEHDLPRALLALQVRGAALVQAPLRFADQAARRRALATLVVPHGRLLAHLGGASLRMQQPLVDALTLGLAYTGHLATLSRDLADDRLFLPLETLDQHGVTVEELREGALTDGLRRMLWRESVRARDLLARGRPLLDELPWRLRYGTKRWWLGALELLNEIEVRDYDVWNQPPHLSRLHRAQVELQALFGRAGARTR